MTALAPPTYADPEARLAVAVERAAHRLTWRVFATSLALSMVVGLYFVLASPEDDPHLVRPLAVLTYVLTGLCIMFSTLVADERVALGAKRLPAYVGAVLVGVSVAALLQWPLHEWLRSSEPIYPYDVRIVHTTLLFFESLAWGSIIVFVYVNRRSALLAAERMKTAQLERTETQRRFVEARLQGLQARVEPQFLFDTLARVRDLYDHDAARGNRVLGDLIAYLRAALPHPRHATSSLGHELALVAAYVNVVQAELGERLSCVIEPNALPDGARMPAMILLPLVQQALRRAPPGAEGRAAIRIAAERSDGKLCLIVAHSGAGFAAAEDGDSRRAIEQRLRRLYGVAWRLAFERSHDAGTQAVIEIPYEAGDGDHR